MPEETERGKLVHQAIVLLIRTSKRHHCGIERQFNDTGLHRSQRSLLKTLSLADGPLSQKELAARLDVSAASIARSLKTLESEGYISRADDKSDLRRNHVSITEKGQAVVEKTQQTFDRFDSTLFEGFSDEELAQLISLLERVDQNLARSEENAPDVPNIPKGSAFP